MEGLLGKNKESKISLNQSGQVHFDLGLFFFLVSSHKMIF